MNEELDYEEIYDLLSYMNFIEAMEDFFGFTRNEVLDFISEYYQPEEDYEEDLDE